MFQILDASRNPTSPSITRVSFTLYQKSWRKIANILQDWCEDSPTYPNIGAKTLVMDGLVGLREASRITLPSEICKESKSSSS